MYDPGDCVQLQEIFQEFIRKWTSNLFYDYRVTDKGKISREERLHLQANKENKFLWTEFTKAVLDFQLHEHEKFLKKFRQIYKTVDTDNNGILNEHEFTRLIQMMGICDSDGEIEYFLQVVDPYNN